LPKSAKADPQKVAAEIKGMQQELKNLQNALVDLVNAMITEEKPGPKEIKKLESLKKKAQNGDCASLEVTATKRKNKLAVVKREKLAANK
jgi:hypothetical protein